MALSTTNYFDRVKKVDFSKLPEALRKSHDLVKRVGTGSEPWANYHASEPIRNMINTYFDKMDAYLEANGMGEKKAPEPKAPKPAKNAKKAAPVAAKKLAKAKTVDKPKATPAAKPGKVKHPEIEYFNSKGKLVKGHLDPEKLYYLQPDGSYEQGGDRRSPGRVTPPKAKAAKTPKAPKAAKPKKVDTREQVPALTPEVKFAQKFLRLVDRPVVLADVQRLHRSLEKDITKRAVRVSSKHEAMLDEVARLVASTYERMVEREIGSIDKLEYPAPPVAWARELVAGVRVGTATNLLSRFINMQGTTPTEKAATALRKALEHEHKENPDGDFALAVGAAAAVLTDWQPGKPVRVTKQQLSGLNGLLGLGCPGTPAKPCGCGSKKAGR